jgi:phosphoribosylamine-glycine ligase
LTLSPYPYSEDISHAAAHLQGLAPISYTENVWPMDVMMKDGEPCIAGTSAIIGVVSAQFSAIEGCRQRAYREIDRIKKTDDLQYRSDIGEDAQDKINILKEWGWV